MRNRPLRLTLSIPGLMGSEFGRGFDTSQPGFPLSRGTALRRLFARARRAPEFANADALRYRLLGFALPDSQDRPDAWSSYRADTGRTAPNALLRADPVHLRADRSRLVLFGPDHLRIGDEEVHALAEAFNRHSVDDGLRLEFPVATRGYLHLPRRPAIRTTPLVEALGRDIDACLPSGPEQRDWHRLLNEAQMLFHEHPVNRARESSGRPLINSLWLWGGGEPVLPGACEWCRIWSTDAVLRGLADIAGTDCSDPPGGASAWLEQVGAGDHLICLDRLREPVAYGDLDSWLREVDVLDEAWFAPLLAAVHRGKPGQLDLYPGDGWVYRLRRRDLWSFWRMRRAD